MEAWIVVREESHIKPKFWVCLDKDEALSIADDVSSYWIGDREASGVEINTKTFGGNIFQVNIEDGADIWVEPITINCNKY